MAWLEAKPVCCPVTVKRPILCVSQNVEGTEEGWQPVRGEQRVADEGAEQGELSRKAGDGFLCVCPKARRSTAWGQRQRHHGAHQGTALAGSGAYQVPCGWVSPVGLAKRPWPYKKAKPWFSCVVCGFFWFGFMVGIDGITDCKTQLKGSLLADWEEVAGFTGWWDVFFFFSLCFRSCVRISSCQGFCSS